MDDHMTARLGLPLVQAAQAQKHVTVNESLARLDGMVNLVLLSDRRATPPEAVVDGSCYFVPEGAGGSWAGQAGQIAVASNGGWIFLTPDAGMRGFILDQGTEAIFDGERWVAGALTLAQNGAALMARVAEAEVAIDAGGEVVTDLIIPHAAMVIGVTARVVEEITGTLSGWRIGTAGALDRFGTGLGTGVGAWGRGMLSQPLTYWSPEPLVLTAEGGAFSGGRVALAAHWLELGLPR